MEVDKFIMDIKALKEECEVEMFFSYTEVLELIEIIEQQQKENNLLQEKYDYWHSKCNQRFKENKRLKEAYEYVDKAINTQHVTMNHMENTDYERGQISGLIIAGNIVTKTLDQYKEKIL